MKKPLFIAFFFFLLFGSKVQAQYVTISDPGMVSWLTANYPSAMIGNQMDTTDLFVTNAQSIYLYNNIINTDGLQYFDSITYLNANYVGTIQVIPAFPPRLIEIQLSSNSISSLGDFPTTLDRLVLAWNDLDSLPDLPNGIRFVDVSGNHLNQLPNLPYYLKELNCSGNNLSVLPSFPVSLEFLICSENNLVALPLLPQSLSYLYCEINDLVILPDLPNTLQGLRCTKNYNLNCLPILPYSLTELSVDSTNISCLPNYPSQLTIIDVQGLPYCQSLNINDCQDYISGAVYYNTNNNCINTSNLTTQSSFHLFDGQNNFLQSRSSSINDNYYFSIQPGNYAVRMDSSFFTNSVAVNCPITNEHLVTALLDSSYADRDFGVTCLGVDVGVEAIIQQGIVFPGQPHSVKALIGDLSNYFGLNCANGTGGTVHLNVSGPVTYIGFPSTALSPTVSGNSYSYNIANFGTTNIQESFVLNFLTDTTAQTGNVITVIATIIPNSTDLDSTNNTLTYTYSVVNSYDPNMKLVNPVDVLPGYQDYFTYTVHFQNLGSAPAFNIKIKDTLDSNLDFATFRVINASHDYSYNLSADLLTVYFPNIMLADSASNPEGSKGFVQYQIKPKANLLDGMFIENTAHIYFDFNPAVVTNTTTNSFVDNLSIAENQGQLFSIFPNPTSGNLTIVSEQKGNETLGIQIFDLLGKNLLNESLNFKNGLADLHLDLNSGSYIIVLATENGSKSSHRLVIQK